MSSIAPNFTGLEPLVSILIISYNQEAYIEEAILSAVSQNYNNLEVIVSDDASTDGTVEIIKRYENIYPGRVVAVLNKNNSGITANSNYGLNRCRGEFVALQGGDDVLLPGKINSQVKWFLEKANRVLCGHKVETFYMDGTKSHLHARFLKIGVGPTSLIRGGPPYCATSIMLRKSAMPAHGFQSKLINVSDNHLYIETLINGGEYGYVQGIYAKYRRHNSNVTNRRDEMTEEIKISLQILKSTYPVLSSDCSYAVWSHYIYGCAMNAMIQGDNKKALILFSQCIRKIPNHFKSWIRFFQAGIKYLF